MEKYNFPLCCYSNGEIVVEGEDVAYKDGEQFFVFVGSSNNFLELSELICKELEVNLIQFELKIKMKYPSVRGYKVVSLNNDGALKAMWASVYHSNAASMDLYVELIPIQQINGTSNVSLLHENASFSSMLSHVMRGDDPLSCVSLLANSVDQEQFDDDFDEYEEFVLRNGFDDEGDDLVTASAPNIEFARLCPIDEKLDNSWCDKGVKHHENDYSITRRIIGPHSSGVNEDYYNYHTYIPTTADYQALTQSNMFNYNKCNDMLSNKPADVYKIIEQMRDMSLNTLISTRQGHLVGYKEEEEHVPTPPRYNFRNFERRVQYAEQDETEEAESSARQRKKGKGRRGQ